MVTKHLAPIASSNGAPLLEAIGLSKRYGSTQAVSDVTWKLRKGTIAGLVGANGAGKSTFLKMIDGTVKPTSGRLIIDSAEVDPQRFQRRMAESAGIYTVFQELSVCSNLSVAENFMLVTGERRIRKRSEAATNARQALEDIFPGANVAANVEVATLSLADRQMVEIARAATSPGVRVLILDEPTSSLSRDRVTQLHEYVIRRAKAGLTVIYVTHILEHVLEVAEAVTVMRQGKITWQGATGQLDREQLVAKFLQGSSEVTQQTIEGSARARNVRAVSGRPQSSRGEPLVQVRGLSRGAARDVALHVGPGEVVGIAGLEGAGQRDVLHAIWDASRSGRAMGRKQPVTVRGGAAYVSGDRSGEGVFPLWSVGENVTVSVARSLARFGVIPRGATAQVVRDWTARLAIVPSNPTAEITHLSGGNQQKALIGRGLATGAALVILDDPTRGVDIEAKDKLYALLGEIRDGSRGAVWYSSDDSEFQYCDRVYVMAKGRVMRELSGGEINVDEIVRWSYAVAAVADKITDTSDAIGEAESDQPASGNGAQ
jgi:ribose transport system ATP-binding protein